MSPSIAILDRAALVRLPVRYGPPLLALAMSPSKALGNLALILMLLAWLGRARSSWPEFAGSAWGRWWLVFAAWLLLGAALAPALPGTGLTDHLRVAKDFMWVFLAVYVVAWAVTEGGHDGGRLLAWFVAGLLLSELLAVLRGGADWSVWSGAVRSGLAMYNPNTLGLYGGAALICLLLAGPDRLPGVRAPAALARGAWLLALAAVAEALFVSQSRSAWLGLVVVLPPVLLLAFRRPAGRAVLVVGAVLLLVLLALNAGTVGARMAAEWETYRALWHGAGGAVPSADASGQRIHMWRLGWQAWTERPWTGWGAASAGPLLAASEVASIRHHPHFHNMPLDVAVRSGLVGLLLVLGFFVLLFRAARGPNVPRVLAWTLTALLALFLLDSLATLLLLRNQGLFYLALCGGIAYSFEIRRRRTTAPPPPRP